MLIILALFLFLLISVQLLVSNGEAFEFLTAPAPGHPFHLAIPVHSIAEGILVDLLSFE